MNSFQFLSTYPCIEKVMIGMEWLVVGFGIGIAPMLGLALLFQHIK